MGDTRSEYEDLLSIYLPVAVAVVVIVVFATLAVAVRYRRSRAPEPSERSSARGLEVAYALLLTAVAVVLVAFTFNATGDIDRRAGNPAAEIDVTAAKWNWRFDYRGLGISQVGSDSRPPILVVPTGVPVRFHLRARDVQHAFWVPELRFKRDALPGRTTSFDLLFDQPGLTSTGACAEFCGLRHGDMRFLVRKLTPADFRGWVAGRGER